MNQITKDQINELINLRLSTIGLVNYSWDLSEIDDNIIKWLLKVNSRIK